MALSTNGDTGPVQVGQRAEVVDGQPQAAPRPLHDGRHFTHEVAAITDRVILDPNDELAVQIPEGVGASTYGHRSPLGEALATGTPESQFEAEASDSKKSASDTKVTDQKKSSDDKGSTKSEAADKA